MKFKFLLCALAEFICTSSFATLIVNLYLGLLESERQEIEVSNTDIPDPTSLTIFGLGIVSLGILCI
jgi:hypothetical protein